VIIVYVVGVQHDSSTKCLMIPVKKKNFVSWWPKHNVHVFLWRIQGFHILGCYSYCSQHLDLEVERIW